MPSLKNLDGGLTNWAGGGGYPTGVISKTSPPVCGLYSENTAECEFTCSQAGAFGFGKIRCDSGVWKKIPNAECIIASQDKVQAQPKMIAADPVGTTQVLVKWAAGISGKHSAAFKWNFNVVPAGELKCDTFFSAAPPPSGTLCSGALAGKNVGHYEIRVNAQNNAGVSPWSEPFKNACPALKLTTQQAAVMTHDCDTSVSASCQACPDDVDGLRQATGQNAWTCIYYKTNGGCTMPQVNGNNVIPQVYCHASCPSGASCQVKCRPGMYGSPSQETFTCDQRTMLLTGTFPICKAAAKPPFISSISAVPSTTDSVAIKWTMMGLGDSPVKRWKVEMYDKTTKVWQTPSGCAGITDKCTSECTATGLTSNTGYDVRVQAIANISALDSPWSKSEVGTTLPQRAEKPKGLTEKATTGTTATFEWQAGNQNDCTFEEWKVELRGPSGTWVLDPNGCQNLNVELTRSCTLTGLACETTYSVHVFQQCTSAVANSDKSAQLPFTTGKDSSCLTQAGTPKNLKVLKSSDTSIRLTWDASTLKSDCQFQAWSVMLQSTKQGVDSTFKTPKGCEATALNLRSVTQCVATGLGFGAYRFHVSEVCQDTNTNSPVSQDSNDADLPPDPAAAPTNVVLSNPAQASLQISWDQGRLNDAVFAKFEVYLAKEASGVWSDLLPSQWTGCDNLLNSCETTCTVAGLLPNTAYQARVRVIATDSRATSQDSASSSSVATLPARASIPGLQLYGAITADTIAFGISKGPADGDCAFRVWELELQVVGQSVWNRATCATSTSNWIISDLTKVNANVCKATRLVCDTSYIARLKMACTNPAADSPYKISPSYKTLKGASCWKSIMPPANIHVTSATTNSLSVAWSPGVLNDGTFKRYELQYQIYGGSDWTTPNFKKYADKSARGSKVLSILAPAPPPPAAIEYALLNIGNCELVQRLVVGGVSECSAAAHYLKLSDTTAEPDGLVGSKSKPKGCYMSGTTLMYNANGNSGSSNTTLGIVSICLKAQDPYISASYELIEKGRCQVPVMTLAECSSAGKYLKARGVLQDASPVVQAIRFTPTKLRDDSASNSVHIAEIEFRISGNTVSMGSAQATNPGGSNPSGEEPQKAIDGQTSTKWSTSTKVFLKYLGKLLFPSTHSDSSQQMITQSATR
jgi:hypothetical protein